MSMTRLVTTLTDAQKVAYKQEIVARLRLADAAIAEYRTERAVIEPREEAHIISQVRESVLAGLSFVPEELVKRASTTNTPDAPLWLVRVIGPKPEDPRFKRHNFRFENGAMIAGFQHESKAKEVAEGLSLIDSKWKVTIDPPAGRTP